MIFSQNPAAGRDSLVLFPASGSCTTKPSSFDGYPINFFKGFKSDSTLSSELACHLPQAADDTHLAPSPTPLHLGYGLIEPSIKNRIFFFCMDIIIDISSIWPSVTSKCIGLWALQLKHSPKKALHLKESCEGHSAQTLRLRGTQLLRIWPTFGSSLLSLASKHQGGAAKANDM